MKEAKQEQGLTVFVLLDESGSMDWCMHQTIKATNEYIRNLTLAAMPAMVTVNKFGNFQVSTIIDNRPAYELPQLTARDYYPMGGTPLCRAIGESIEALDKIPARQKAMVILTDGDDSGTTQWPKSKIKAMVKERIKQGWLFLFLGADEANAQSAATLGIPKDQVLSCSLGNLEDTMALAAMGTLSFQSDGKLPTFTAEQRQKIKG